MNSFRLRFQISFFGLNILKHIRRSRTLNITLYVKQLRGAFTNFASNDTLAVKTKPRFIKIW